MDSILKLRNRQDLQDFLDYLHCRFPDETGNMQSASRKKRFTTLTYFFLYWEYIRVFLNMVIQKDQVEGMLSILSPSLNPSRRGREVKSHLLWFCR